MEVIDKRIVDYWARQEQKILVSVLVGAFAATNKTNHVLDKSTASAGINGKYVT